jgi:hypothetical protein
MSEDMHHDASGRRRLLAALLVVSAAVFSLTPAYQLLELGPFGWHVRQPQVVQGGSEALILVFLSMLCLAANNKYSLSLLLLAGIAYLRRHAVDVALLLDVVYFEIIVGLGFFIARGIAGPMVKAGKEDYLRALSLGIVAWGLGAWAMALLNMGSIAELRAYSALLAIPAVLGRKKPYVLHALQMARGQPLKDRLWCGFLIAWGLVLLARSKVVVGYDSLWYGLRGEYVLDPGASFLEHLNLVSPVYYFPKLYEVLLLPLSGLGDFSVIQGMAVILLLPVAAVSLALLDRMSAPAIMRWPLVAAAVTTPALSNVAISPKPDVIAALFVLLAGLKAIDWRNGRRPEDACWFAVHVLLAASTKLVAIPYVAALAAVVLAVGFFASTKSAPSSVSERRLAYCALGGTCLLATGVTMRTWTLTGMPTVGPEALVNLWEGMGLRFVEPTGSIRWIFPVNWPDIPILLLDAIMRPQHRMPHMIISWVGNVWVWMALVSFLAPVILRVRKSGSVSSPMASLLVTGFLLFACVGYAERGSDGNYFICAVIPAILIAGSGAAKSLHGSQGLRRTAEVCTAAFVALYASYSFVSASWTPGTRAWDLNFREDWRGAAALRERSLGAAGLQKIGDYLRQKAGPDVHVVGSTIETAGNWLPVKYESIEQISYARPDYISSEENFRKFIGRFGIRYVIVPTPAEEAKANPNTAPTPPAVSQAVAELSKLDKVTTLEDRRHVLLDLSALTADELMRPQ